MRPFNENQEQTLDLDLSYDDNGNMVMKFHDEIFTAQPTNLPVWSDKVIEIMNDLPTKVDYIGNGKLVIKVWPSKSKCQDILGLIEILTAKKAIIKRAATCLFP